MSQVVPLGRVAGIPQGARLGGRQARPGEAVEESGRNAP